MSSAGAEDISVHKTLTGIYGECAAPKSAGYILLWIRCSGRIMRFSAKTNRYFQELHIEKNICLGTLVLHILRGFSSAQNMGFI